MSAARNDRAHWTALAEAPWRHDFFGLLRWIESRHVDKPRLGTARRPVDEPLRLQQAPDLSFAPAALHSVLPADAIHATPRVAVRFFGMFGPNGPLPLHLSEQAYQRGLQQRDTTLSAFTDVFHHRLLLLFYRAWAQGQPTVSLDRPADDRFGQFVGSLIGQGLATSQRRDAAPDTVKRHFAGWLSRSVRSAEGLESILTGFIGHQVRVECFVGHWVSLGAEACNRLGGDRGPAPVRQARLGSGAMLGDRVWDRQHHARVHIGPLDNASFERLLPGGDWFAAVNALTDGYVGDELGWDLHLSLRAQDVRASSLRGEDRLGRSTWLGDSRPPCDRDVAVMPRVATLA